jgi:hypothetical protein
VFSPTTLKILVRSIFLEASKWWMQSRLTISGHGTEKRCKLPDTRGEFCVWCFSFLKIRFQTHWCALECWSASWVCESSGEDKEISCCCVLISVQDVNNALHGRDPGTFLVRFSERHAGQFAVAYVGYEMPRW